MEESLTPKQIARLCHVNDKHPSYEEIINFALFANCNPFTFEEASSDKNWRKVMDDEIHAIEKNDM